MFIAVWVSGTTQVSDNKGLVFSVFSPLIISIKVQVSLFWWVFVVTLKCLVLWIFISPMSDNSSILDDSVHHCLVSSKSLLRAFTDTSLFNEPLKWASNWPSYLHLCSHPFSPVQSEWSFYNSDLLVLTCTPPGCLQQFKTLHRTTRDSS